MNTWYNSIRLYQEYDDGIFEASHTYHSPKHDSHAKKVPNRIIYIKSAIERFDLLKNQLLLTDLHDPYDTVYDKEFGIDTDYRFDREKTLKKDRNTFLNTVTDTVISAINDDNTLVYLDHAIEGWNHVRLEDVAYIFGIPVERLVWVTSMYKHNRYDSHPMGDNVIYINFWETFVKGSLLNPENNYATLNFQQQMELYLSKKKRHRLCSSYMRRRRPLRCVMAMMLHQQDLLKHMYWSFGRYTDGLNNDILIESRIDKLEYFMKKNYDNILDGNDFSWLRSCDKNITCDSHDTNNEKLFGLDSLVPKHAFNTKFALVNETIPNGVMTRTTDDIPFLSEKSFKPIVTGQLFLIHGCKGTISSLRERGYDVFDDVLHHGYDDQEDPILRCLMICDEIKRLSSIPDHIWEDTLKSLVPRFEYNFNHISNIKAQVQRANIQNSPIEIIYNNFKN